MKLTNAIIVSFLLAAGCAYEDEISTDRQESHSWGNYHWARSSNPIKLTLGDNVSSQWDGHLATASSDWTKSTVLDTSIVGGAASNRKCTPAAGKIEVCNDTYGRNGWLGIAQIWASGDHITQASTRLNDTYFNMAQYNSPAWRQFVACQEIGHDFGLDHQDENFDNANLGTCMDYTSNPSTNQHPNQHDYAQLEDIYAHLDGASGGGGGGGHGHGNADDWGELVDSSHDGHHATYVKDHGNGNRLITHVLYVE
jgi:hypothetical protein